MVALLLNITICSSCIYQERTPVLRN